MNDSPLKSPIIKTGFVIFGAMALLMAYFFITEYSEGLKDPRIWLYLISGVGPIVVAILIARMVKTSYHIRTMILAQVFFIIRILQYIFAQIFSENPFLLIGIILSLLIIILLSVYIKKLIKKTNDIVKWTDIVFICELVYFSVPLVVMISTKRIILDLFSISSILFFGIVIIIWWFRVRHHLKMKIFA